MFALIRVVNEVYAEMKARLWNFLRFGDLVVAGVVLGFLFIHTGDGLCFVAVPQTVPIVTRRKESVWVPRMAISQMKTSPRLAC